jgi:hypothetical protein
VKHLSISIAILLTGFLSFIPAFAEAPGYDTSQLREDKERPAKKPVDKETTDANSIADANAATDVNATTDPNVVRARIEQFEGLEEALNKVTREGKKEMREWTQGTAEDKLDLVQAVQEQVTAEFNFLRELAVEEGAVKTTAAIDGLLADRQERFGKIIKKMERDRERFRRRSEREDRRSRDRDRGRDREPRRRSREDRSRRSETP